MLEEQRTISKAENPRKYIKDNIVRIRSVSSQKIDIKKRTYIISKRKQSFECGNRPMSDEYSGIWET